MAQSDSFTVETRGPVEILTLNRPEVLNALSTGVAERISHYFAALHQREDVRVVLLRAAGRSFCAGMDLKAAVEDSGESQFSRSIKSQKVIGAIIRQMRSCPQPIIALAQGSACGAGFSLLLAADVRYGTPDLRMNAAYAKIGVSGCDLGSSYFLPRLVGASLAAELILTGRFIHAERALRLGLLSDIVEHEQLLDTGLALANEMLGVSPYGLRMSKAALNLNIDAPSLETAMAIEDRQQVLLGMTDDFQEAVRAFAEKRPPAFSGR